MADEGEVKLTDAKGSSDYIRTYVDRLANVVDTHQREIRLATAGFAVLGIVIIGRTVRVFTTFRRVEDIPKRFIVRHIQLQGHVKQVDDLSTIHIQHVPIISLGHFGRRASPLPIKLAGVDVLGPGCTWLQRNLVGHSVQFQPVAVTDQNQLECIISARLGWFRRTCINRELVVRGLAFVRPMAGLYDDAHPDIRRLESSLNNAESKAERWRRGAWVTPSVFARFLQRPSATLRRAFYDSLPVSIVTRQTKKAKS